METLNKPFKNLEELSKYLTLDVIFQLKLALNANSIELNVYEDVVTLTMKTLTAISKLPSIINTCSSWLIYSENNATCVKFSFNLDE